MRKTPIALKAIMAAAAMAAMACGDVVTPKPRGYFRIELPEHAYTKYSCSDYTFEHSSLSHVGKAKWRGSEDGWMNISYPTLNCDIHLTYLEDLDEKGEQMAYEDNHEFAYKHTIRADAIGESYFDSPEHRVYATLYDIKGNAASPQQFAITDSAGRMFRGSLYFNCRPNKDSLAPVVGYIREDITHLIETFRWSGD